MKFQYICIKEIIDLIQQIESVTPDTDDFGELIGSLTLNAAGLFPRH